MKASLDPVKTDRKGEQYDSKDVSKVVVNSINNEAYFGNRRAIDEGVKEVELAQQKLDKMLTVISGATAQLIAHEAQVTEKTRRIGGSVRDAAEKLSGSLVKIEKAANFDRLERYVALLERAAAAMTVLGELEKTGRLEKIASAIR